MANRKIVDRDSLFCGSVQVNRETAMSLFNPASISFLNAEGQSKVIGSFLSQLSEYTVDMERAEQAKATKDVARIAHRLKGACLALRADSLTDICTILEERAELPDTNLSNMLAKFYAAIKETSRVVQSYYDDLQHPPQ